MKQTIAIKLCPTEEQKEALLDTMTTFNEACNRIAETAFENRCANKIRLQKMIYHSIRKEFGLSAQLTIRAIAKVAGAYKRDKNIKPKFSLNGAIVYDQRILSWKEREAVSILTTKGRLKIPITFGDYQKARFERIRGQADLIYKNRVFYVYATIETPEASKFKPEGILGVDMGM